MFQQIIAIIAPVLVIALIGYAWERRNLPFDNTMVSTLVTYIGSPCLLLNTLLKARPDLLAVANIVGAAVLLIVLTAPIAWSLLKVLKLPVRPYLPAMMFPNSGNMGLPLCLFAFGDTGLALAVGFFATMATLQFSVGVSIASGHISLRSLATNPAMIAAAIAVAMLATDTVPPQWVSNTLDVLGNLMIPLMLLSLGTSLARLKITAFGRGLGFAAFRLGIGFTLGLLISWAMGLEGAARGVIVIQSTMPTAVFNYIFAVRYGNRPEEVAGIILIATILSFLTLPALMAFVLAL